jgi:hypothetical protein
MDIFTIGLQILEKKIKLKIIILEFMHWLLFKIWYNIFIWYSNIQSKTDRYEPLHMSYDFDDYWISDKTSIARKLKYNHFEILKKECLYILFFFKKYSFFREIIIEIVKNSKYIYLKWDKDIKLYKII